MRIKFKPNKNQMNFTMTEADLVDIHEIEKTAQTYGAQVLDRYHEVTREEIIENIKACALNPMMPKEMLLVRIGTLIGYDEQRMVKDKVIAKKDDFIEKQNQEKELQNQYKEEGEIL